MSGVGPVYLQKKLHLECTTDSNKIIPYMLVFVIISLIGVQFMPFPLLEEAKMSAFCMTLAAVFGQIMICFY